MGIFPTWGFQMLIGITLAFLLRLNKVLVIVAANISIPPMIPLILFLSHLTGSVWMGDKAQRISFSSDITLHSVQTSFVQYILGAVTLAVIAGIVSGSITYVMLKIFKRSKS
jgi:uncharacterized protein (DUF2062 family)